MTHTLVIETQVETGYQLLLELAHRLGLHVREPDRQSTNDSQQRQFDELFGSWQSDETGDQLRQAQQDAAQPVDLRNSFYSTPPSVWLHSYHSSTNSCHR